MTFIFLDESGDLGFNEKGSKYFIISCVKIDDEETLNALRRIPKKVRNCILKKKFKKQSKLKFSNSSEIIRTRFLTRVSMLNVEIYSLIIDKKYTYIDLKNNLPVLYNYLIKKLFEFILSEINTNEKLLICLDKCMSARQIENFENYVNTEFLSIFEKLPKLKITHESSSENECLQVIDFICGSFGYKYNYADLQKDCEKYTNIIKSKIKLEKKDLFRKIANHAYSS